MPQLADTGPSLSGPGTTVDDWMSDAATYNQVPLTTIRKMLRQESGGKQSAVSPKGAVGLMQIMPSTAPGIKWYDPRSRQMRTGVNVNDPYENLMGGTAYFKSLLKKYDGNQTKALAAYNWGEGNVDKFGLGKAPAETLNYINSIQEGLRRETDAPDTVSDEDVQRSENNSQTLVKPTPFYELAKNLPASLSQDDYDAFRHRYFDQYVRPRLTKADSPLAAWDRFDKNTRRAGDLSPRAQRLALPFQQFGSTLMASLTAPAKLFASQAPQAAGAAAHAEAVAKMYTGKAAQQNASMLPSMAGAMVGSVPEFAAVAPMLPETLAATVPGLVKAYPLATRILGGSLTMGALSAAEADDGERWAAGAKGAAWGGLWELGLGGPGKLWRMGKEMQSPKAADTAMRAAASADPAVQVPPAVDEALADYVDKSGKAGKEEGRPREIRSNGNIKNIRVSGTTADGQPWQVRVTPGSERAAVRRIVRITKAGGAVDLYEHNPNAHEGLMSFMKFARDYFGDKYEGERVEETIPGQEEEVAQNSRIDGKAAEPVGDGKVIIQDARREEPGDNEINAHVSQLRDTDENGQTSELTKFQKDTIGTAVKKMWDPDVEDAAKQRLMNTVLRGHNVDDIVPEQWRSEYRVMTPAEREAEAAMSTEEARGVEERQRAFEEMRGRELGTPIETQESKPLNRYQEVEPLLRRDEPRELLESAPPEIWQGLGAEVEREHPFGRIPEGMERTVPPSERSTLEVASNGRVVRRVKYPLAAVTTRPFSTAVQISAESMEKFGRGAAGFAAPVGISRVMADRLGISEAPAGPTVVFKPFLAREGGVLPARTLEPGTPYADYGTVYHESLHTMGHHAGDIADIMQQSGKVTNEIARGISQWKTYALMSQRGLNEEAFVHLATAIRMGRTADLAEYVKMDGTLDEVLRMVNGKAQQIQDALKWTTIDSVPARIIDRKMSDMVRRTSADPLHDLITSTEDYLKDYRYDAETRMWYEDERAFESRKELLDHVDEQAKAHEIGPSQTLMFEARGVRGPFNPPNSGPVKDELPQFDVPPEIEGAAWAAEFSRFRPTEPWMDTAGKKINAALAKAGKSPIPFYPRYWKVSQGVRQWEQWTPPRFGKMNEILRGGAKGADNAYLDMLGSDEKHWSEMAKQYNVSEDDLARVPAMREWAEELKVATDGKVDLMKYLREDRPRLRQVKRPDGTYDLDKVFGPEKPEAEQGFFERRLRKGQLDPSMNYAGVFFSETLRQSAYEKFLEAPATDFQKLINLKAKNDAYVLGDLRSPAEKYLNYVRGIPDESTMKVNKLMREAIGGLNKRIRQANEYLPSYVRMSELPDSPAYLQNLMTRVYASTMGLRPATYARELIQPFLTAMPVLGVKNFTLGMTRSMTREGYAFAKESGALLGNHTTYQIYGDFSQEIPAGASKQYLTRFANKVLSPVTKEHNINRATFFNGAYEPTLNGIREYRAGRLSWEEFSTDNNHGPLWFMGDSYKDMVKGQLADQGFTDEEVAKNISLEALDRTQWPYRRGSQPGLLRTGYGRIFGQFGIWPLNFGEFLRQMAVKGGRDVLNKNIRGQGLAAVATWSAVNYMGSHLMNGLGADQGKWFWISPATIDLSPHAQFVIDLGKSPEDSAEGREAKRRVLSYPMSFIPSEVEARNVYDFIHSGASAFDNDDRPTPEFIRALGFRPFKEEPDRDFEQELLYQMGYTETRTGDIEPTLIERERQP